MFTLSLKIDEDLVAEYELESEEEAKTLVGRFINLSRDSWEYNSETKTWSCDIRMMQITENGEDTA